MENAVLEPPAPASIPPTQQFTAIDPADDPFTKFDAPKETAKPPGEKPQRVQMPQNKPTIDPEKEEEKPAEPEEKTEKEPEAKVPEKEPAPPAEPKTPKALREAYDRLKREMKERETKHAEELENFRKSTAPKDDPEKLELAKKYAELEKKWKQADEELAFTDFEKSEKFKTEFETPYVNIWNEAVAQLADYRVTNDDGTERPATTADLAKVAQAGSMPEARRIAKSLFGEEDAQDIVLMRNKIVEAHRNMQAAKEDYRKNGAARREQQQREQALASEQAATNWKKLNQEAVEKYPQWFKADEADKKGAELLKKGFEIADLAFSGTLPPDKAIALHSAVRNQAAGFRYMVHKYETAQATIKDLEAKLAGFKASQPGTGEARDVKKNDDELGDPFARFS
jgi:hypothetical protein